MVRSTAHHALAALRSPVLRTSRNSVATLTAEQEKRDVSKIADAIQTALGELFFNNDVKLLLFRSVVRIPDQVRSRRSRLVMHANLERVLMLAPGLQVHLEFVEGERVMREFSPELVVTFSYYKKMLDALDKIRRKNPELLIEFYTHSEKLEGDDHVRRSLHALMTAYANGRMSGRQQIRRLSRRP